MPRPSITDLRSRLEEIKQEIAKHQLEIDKLKAKEEMLLELLDEAPVPVATRAKKGSVKTTVLELLEEVGPSGLNAVKAVDMAAQRGLSLERGSVSSLLSRLKSDGVVSHDGKAYRLNEHSGKQGGTVHPLQPRAAP